MKKLFPLILIIVLVTLACGASGLVNTSIPAVTETPALTETPIASPAPAGPYANISSDQAEFWFPLPDKEEWTWTVETRQTGDGIPTPCPPCEENESHNVVYEHIWKVNIPTLDGKAYQIDVSFKHRAEDDPRNKYYTFESKTGSFEELFKLMSNNITVWSGNSGQGLYGDIGMATSISNGGLLIVVTNPEVLKTLNDTKPSVLTFSSMEDGNQDIDVSPSYGGTPAASIPANPASDATSAPVVESTAEEPAVEAGQFFTEEFNGDTTNWTLLPSRDKAENDKLDVSVQDGALVFDIKSRNELGGILTYDANNYADVRIDARVENLNNDFGGVSLICRYNGENWYEFFMTNNGYYGINYVFWSKGQTNARYQNLYNGATDKIVLGPGVNEYTAICKGKTLSFFINGVEVHTIEETAFNLTSAGKVAISAYALKQYKSFDINFDWVKISQP